MNGILPCLKQATRDCHQRLEQRLPLFEPEFGRHDYRRLLQCFLGFYRPLESMVGGIMALSDHLPDVADRRKSAWLETDLKSLGLSRGDVLNLAGCPELPQVDDLPSAFGCLYVVEGATLGGQLICRHLKRALNIEADSGGRFFSSYGPETPAMWRRFGLCIDLAVQGEPSTSAAIQAARETFLCLEAWMEQSDVLARTPA